MLMATEYGANCGEGSSNGDDRRTALNQTAPCGRKVPNIVPT